MKATKKLGMVAGIMTLLVASACGSSKTIIQGNEELSIDEAQYHEALALQDEGQYFEAIKSWAKVIMDEPDFAQAHFNLGLIYDYLNMVPESIQEYEIALQLVEGDNTNLQDDQALYSLHLGVAYMRADMVEDAEVAILKALELDPHSPRVHYNLAAVFMAQHDFDTGLIHADIAVDLLRQPDSKAKSGVHKSVDLTRLGKYMLRQAECHIKRSEWEKARTSLAYTQEVCRVEVPAAMWDELNAGEEAESMKEDGGSEEG